MIPKKPAPHVKRGGHRFFGKDHGDSARRAAQAARPRRRRPGTKQFVSSTVAAEHGEHGGMELESLSRKLDFPFPQA